MTNPAHTEHHHAMNEYKRNYKLIRTNTKETANLSFTSSL